MDDPRGCAADLIQAGASLGARGNVTRRRLFDLATPGVDVCNRYTFVDSADDVGRVFLGNRW